MIIEPTAHSFTSTLQEDSINLAYYSWGSPKDPVIYCVHGLTRNARDFDFIANVLSKNYYVLAIDMPGRGKSDWLQDPLLYNYQTYITVTQQLLASLAIDKVTWLGTSMGGIIGMLVAAMAPNCIDTLILNDVGAFISKNALTNIAKYAGQKVRFGSEQEAKDALRTIYAPFGIHREDAWQHMFTHSIVKQPDGRVTLAYDPRIAEPLQASEPQDVDMWETWKKVVCPTLILRGEQSDILSSETAQQMHAVHPDATVHTFTNVGHAPSLTNEEEIRCATDWLADLCGTPRHSGGGC